MRVENNPESPPKPSRGWDCLGAIRLLGVAMVACGYLVALVSTGYVALVERVVPAGVLFVLLLFVGGIILIAIAGPPRRDEE